MNPSRLLLPLLILTLSGFMLTGGPLWADPAPDKKDTPTEPPQDPKVTELLAKVSAYYVGLNSFQVDITAVMKVEMQGMKNEITSIFNCAMTRPNHFALIMQTGMMGGSVISDGKVRITYLPVLGKYIQEDAPATMGEVMDPMSAPLVTGGLSIGIDSLIATDPATAIAKPGSKTVYLGPDKVGDVATQHIQVVLGPITTDYWFADGDAPLLLQTATAIDMQNSLKHLSDDLKKKMPAGYEKMKSSWSTLYNNWKVNQPVPDSVFAYRPPSTAKKVDSFAAAKPEPVSSLVGKTAPDFTLKDLDGKDVSLASLRGKIVVLDFWATWCPPCVKTLPIVTEVTAERKNSDVVFYAVNLREKADKIQAFQKEKNLFPPVLLDSDGKIAGLYEAKGIPQSVLINKEGKITAVHVGYRADLKKLLTAQLDAMIAGKPLEAPAPPSTNAPAAKAP